MAIQRGALVVSFSALAVIVGLGLLEAVVHQPGVRQEAAVLPDHGAVPDFALTDHHGRSLSRAQLAGSIWIADFIFTRCAGQCPLMTSQMATLQRTFHGLPEVRFVSFTVDPAHDTPEVLAAYAKSYDAEEGRWIFLTGNETEMFRLARDGFRLGVGNDGSVVEPITHSVRFVLVDRTGHIRGYYDATDIHAIPQLEADVKRLAQRAG